MTQQQKKAIQTMILGAGLVALLGMAWASKADKSALDLHIQQSDSRAARLDSMVTDLWCEKNPGARRCR